VVAYDSEKIHAIGSQAAIILEKAGHHSLNISGIIEENCNGYSISLDDNIELF